MVFTHTHTHSIGTYLISLKAATQWTVKVDGIIRPILKLHSLILKIKLSKLSFLNLGFEWSTYS